MREENAISFPTNKAMKDEIKQGFLKILFFSVHEHIGTHIHVYICNSDRYTASEHWKKHDILGSPQYTSHSNFLLLN